MIDWKRWKAWQRKNRYWHMAGLLVSLGLFFASMNDKDPARQAWEAASAMAIFVALIFVFPMRKW